MSITIVSIYPALLGTYGDVGNVLALRYQAEMRGIDLDVVNVQAGRSVPSSGDLYVLGGGEDSAQVAAANEIRADGTLRRAADRGAVVLAVCAGYQLLGEYFPDSTGKPVEGLGILDIRTDRLPNRAVGELVAKPYLPGLPLLTGYENHGGATHLGSDAEPLAEVVTGVGNGDGTEGARNNKVIGTYLHGPGLTRNPALADLLLGWCLGEELPPVEQPEIDALRNERLEFTLGEGSHGQRRTLPGQSS